MTGRRTVAVVLVGVGALAVGCGSSGSLSQQVRQWAGGSGWSSTVSQLGGDLRHLTDVGSDSAGLRRTVCDVLVTDALDANEQLPTPDAALTSLLSTAYTAAGAAGRDCYSGGPQLSDVPVEQQSAERALVEAQARYDELTSSLSVGS